MRTRDVCGTSATRTNQKDAKGNYATFPSKVVAILLIVPSLERKHVLLVEAQMPLAKVRCVVPCVLKVSRKELCFTIC
eukprot:m.97922 g.97922  ORF g.97922 m.97922 type:complete len:78 (-) comp12409_c0_seq5:2099-2332(-)